MTQRQFDATTTAQDVIQDIDLNGQTAVVTGAASGLGTHISHALARAGAGLVLPVRRPDAGQAMAERIRAETGNDNIVVAEMDLADFDSVRAFADTLLDEGRAIHMLVNNAGIMASPLARNAQGYEMQFCTNHLGHFLLTGKLLPLLKQGAPARVVAVSSLGHRLSPIVFEDIHFHHRDYDKWLAYGQAKTANALFAVELTRRYAPDIEAFSVHPGGVWTNLMRDLSETELKALGWVDENGEARSGFKTPEQGAATATWAATAPELTGHGGHYLEDCSFAKPATPDDRRRGYAAHAVDLAAAEKLWHISADMVGQSF